MTTSETPTTSKSLDDIPGPKGVPVLGNMLEIKQATLVQDLMKLTREWGPIFKLNTPTGSRYIASGLEMINDLCDDARFDKLVGVGQRELRKTHESAGLFTADTDDPLWKSAHDILLPSFSTWAMKGYLDPMIDIAEQLCEKWERLNPDEPIDVTADMTRLTLDTIALCGFSYRFNSFYRDSQHPFVAAMMGALQESLARQRLLPIVIKARRRAQKQLLADSKFMDDTVGTIVAERRASGEPGTDLLGHMLVGTDKQGNSLPDHNIVAQCGTFLIAGHETTSGLLSFAIFYLLKHPDVVARAQEEVDRVLGTDPSLPPTVAQVQQLGYIRQILDETLRLWPTAPAFTRQAREATTVGGWGPFEPGQAIIALTPMLHRLPEVWGPDAEDFNPDHFEPQRRDALPPNAYRPFGSGQRACIGRQFALQEATLVLGMLMQRFEFVDHANYQLKIKESLTVKPDGLTITIRPRTGRTWGTAARPIAATAATPRSPALAVAPADRHGTPLLVFFGSNLGASEDLATRIARDATDRGYTARTAALDEAVGELPTDGAVVVVTSSYNGQPPDNAGKFCTWIDAAASSAAGVSYTVFGCGNRDWAATYQAVPTRVDAALEARGATRVYPRGEGDARGDFDAQFEAWYAGLWDALGSALGLDASTTAVTGGGPRLTAEFEQRRTASPVLQSFRAQAATVRANRELTARAGKPGGRSVRHLEITLPAGTSYAAGDHLGVMPRNHVSLINRVLARFGLDAGQYVTLTATGGTPTHLPLGEPYPLLGIVGGCVELQDVASRAGLAAMAARCPEGPARDELARHGGDRRRVEGPLPGEDRDSATDATRPARGAPRVRHAVRGVPRPAALAAPALLLHLLVADDELRRRADRRRPRGRGALRRRLDVPRRVLAAPERGPRARHGVRLRPTADDRLPAAGEPACADDHGGRRYWDGSIPRVPAGAGVAAGPGRPDRHIAAVPRLPGRRGRPALRRRAEGVRGQWCRDAVHGVLAGGGLPEPLRPARPRSEGRRGVGGHAARRGDPRVRQCIDDGTGRPEGTDIGVPRKDRRQRGRRRGLARRSAHKQPLSGGHLGRDRGRIGAFKPAKRHR